MHQLIRQKRKDIETICRRFHVRRLEVIGSAARGEDFDAQTSDVDFLVDLDHHPSLRPLEAYFGLQAALAELLGRPVDLIEPASLRNPYVRASIERSREVVYAA